MENNLEHLRDQHNLSQRELADMIDVTRQTINAIEGNRYDPSVQLVFKLARFFECSVEDIFEPDIAIESTVSNEETQ
jgi:Predicted transcriptional regulators